MMRDVLALLETHGVAFRTTGCLLTLPLNDKDTNCQLSPQLSNLIASFDVSAFKTKQFPDWQRAWAKWQADLTYWIKRIVRDGERDKTRRLRRDLVNVYLEQKTRGYADRYQDAIRIHQEGINQVFSLWRTLDYLAGKFKGIDRSNFPTLAKQLAEDITSYA